MKSVSDGGRGCHPLPGRARARARAPLPRLENWALASLNEASRILQDGGWTAAHLSPQSLAHARGCQELGEAPPTHTHRSFHAG